MNDMKSLEGKLADLIILNHGDIDITEYPQTMADAEKLGLDLGGLNKVIQRIYSQIDWQPFSVINDHLAIILAKGIITEAQFENILGLVENKITRNTVEEYIISELRKKGFIPRGIHHPNPLSIKNQWMTDEIWEQYKESLIAVEWLGKQARSLKDLGDISFNNKEDAKYFLRNANYLPGLITALTKSASKADEFARIIEEEFSSEKRYLRILYKLNPGLPFEFYGKEYTDVQDLLHDACSSQQGYLALRNLYEDGIIQIWLHEADSVAAHNLTGETDYKSFLAFVYTTNPTLPFYLGDRSFVNPEELCAYAQTNFTIWPEIVASYKSGHIGQWFAALGKGEWSDQLEHSRNFLAESGHYTDPEVAMGIIQALFYIADPNYERPKLHVDQKLVQLLNINGGTAVQHAIKITLTNHGYLRAKVTIRNPQTGVTLSKHNLAFNSLEEQKVEIIELLIDTNTLQKDRLYEMEMVISTVYQDDLVLPVQIKVVFPKKAYLQKLAFYGILTAGYFGIFRFLLSTLLNDKGWLRFEPLSGRSGNSIEQAPLLSFVLFALFLFGGLLSFQLIKKFEKI